MTCELRHGGRTLQANDIVFLDSFVILVSFRDFTKSITLCTLTALDERESRQAFVFIGRYEGRSLW